MTPIILLPSERKQINPSFLFLEDLWLLSLIQLSNLIHIILSGAPLRRAGDRKAVDTSYYLANHVIRAVAALDVTLIDVII
jgi:hypothetical protein